MKEFKTIEDQLSILEKRGIIVKPPDELTLLRENYYSLINGYKDPFLDRKAMESSSSDIFLRNTQFSWIYSLFIFDRELRRVTFKYLIQAEAYFKTANVYAFCKAHRKIDEYLNKKAYSKPSEMLVPKNFMGNKKALHKQNIENLMWLFTNKIDKKKTKKDFILHYINKKEPVPLWVLVNDLTFGNIVNFFQLLRPAEQNAVCKYLYVVSEQKEKKNFTPHNILRGFSLLLYFRNICAHDERLYCARKVNDSYPEMLEYLKLFLPKSISRNIGKEIKYLTRKYCRKIHVISRSEMNNMLGV